VSEKPLTTKLNGLLTTGQQDKLADVLAEIVRSGFGEITITVQKGHVRFIRSTVSIEFPVSERTKIT
jgi:hypothetical protein